MADQPGHRRGAPRAGARGHRAAARLPAAADGDPRARRRRGRRLADRAAVLRQLRDGRLRRTPRGRRRGDARRPEPPAGGRRDRGRPGAAAGALARHRRQDHDRRPDAGGRRLRGALRVDRPRGRPGPDRRTRPSPASTSAPRGEDVEEGDLLHRGGHGARPAPPRAARERRPRDRPVPAAAARGRDLDRLGAARARDAARPRLDLRRQLLAAGRLGPPRRRRSPTGSGSCPTSRAAFLDALSDQLVRADLVVTSGGVSMGDYDVVKEALAPLRHRLVRAGRDAARQAAGLRRGRRGRHPDLLPARQPGVVLRLLRDVRAAGAAPADGQAALRPAARTGTAHPRGVLARGAAAVPARRATRSAAAGRRCRPWAAPGPTWSASWPTPTR